MHFTPLSMTLLRSLLAALPLALAACGGGSGGTAAVATATSGAAVAVAAPMVPVPGDRVSLGQQIFTDANLSEPRGTACVACHQANTGFASNHGSTFGVANGSKPGSIGLRNAMTNAYTGFIPVFTFNTSATETEAPAAIFGTAEPTRSPCRRSALF